MEIEKLLKKAITEFMKQNPKAEIRSCYLAGGSGSFGIWSEASFCFEYVEEFGGEYKETYIKVSIDQVETPVRAPRTVCRVRLMMTGERRIKKSETVFEKITRLKRNLDTMRRCAEFYDEKADKLSERLETAEALLSSYDELLQKLNKLNEKMKGLLKL